MLCFFILFLQEKREKEKGRRLGPLRLLIVRAWRHFSFAIKQKPRSLFLCRMGAPWVPGLVISSRRGSFSGTVDKKRQEQQGGKKKEVALGDSVDGKDKSFVVALWEVIAHALP